MATVSKCPHCIRVTKPDVVKIADSREAVCIACGVESGKKCTWICLADGCHLALCGKAGVQHSDEHFKKSGHPLLINVRNHKLWCSECKTQVYADCNIPEWKAGDQMTRKLAQKRKQKRNKNKGSSSPTPTKLASFESVKDTPMESANKEIPTGIAGRAFNEHGVRNLLQTEPQKLESTRPGGLTGLANIGNTCYMSSALQCLSNCPPVQRYFTDPQFERRLSTLWEMNGALPELKPSMAMSFHNLLREIWGDSRRGYTAPHHIFQLMGNSYSSFRGWAQQDSQEFLLCFLELLHKDLRVPVYYWEDRPENQEIKNENEMSKAGSDSNLGRTYSNASSMGSDSDASYETADSGCNSDQDLSLRQQSQASSSISSSRRRRTRSDVVSNNCQDSGFDTSSVRSSNTMMTNSGQSLSAESSTSTVTTRAMTNRTRTSSTIKDSLLTEFLPPNDLMNTVTGPIRYRSPITDIFDGTLISTVRCLTCQRVSTTVETFQDLSLPIPSRDQCEQLDAGNQLSANSYSVSFVPQFSTSWMSYLSSWMSPYAWASWFSGGHIKLTDCLSVFFASDELRGDNMYSCEKCTKLRNGEKRCRIKTLPEILCIQLKRFRHDSLLSSKVSTTVEFPLCDLDMRSFVSQEHFGGESTSYDLIGIVQHMGSASGGHYVACCLNEQDGEWYEYDDSCVTKVYKEDVQSREAYVLFYQRQNAKSHSVGQQFERLAKLDQTGSAMKRDTRASVLRYYISAEWLQRFHNFSEPGPITNHDFLCPHGLISARHARSLPEHYVELNANQWDLLEKNYGGGPVCTNLQYCQTCLESARRLEKRRADEVAYWKLCKREVDRHPTAPHSQPNWCIDTAWIRQWDDYIRKLVPVPPGKMDNSGLLRKDASGQMYLRQSAAFIRVERPLWDMLYSIYGGGPVVKYHNGAQSLQKEPPCAMYTYLLGALYNENRPQPIVSVPSDDNESQEGNDDQSQDDHLPDVEHEEQQEDDNVDQDDPIET